MKEKIKKIIKIFNLRINKNVYYVVIPIILLWIITPFYSKLYFLSIPTTVVLFLSVYWEIKESVIETLNLMKFNIGDFVTCKGQYFYGVRNIHSKKGKVLEIDYEGNIIGVEFYEFIFRGSSYNINGKGTPGRCYPFPSHTIEVVSDDYELEEEFEDED